MGSDRHITFSAFIYVDLTAICVCIIFHLVHDGNGFGGLGKSIKNSNSLVFETCSSWPSFSRRLQRKKTNKVKAIEIDGVASRGLAVWLSQHSEEEPTRGHDTSNTDVRLGRQAQEISAALVDLVNLSSWVIDQVLTGELVEAVIKLEFWDHEKATRIGKFFLLLSSTFWRSIDT